jgi:hypothetical protein
MRYPNIIGAGRPKSNGLFLRGRLAAQNFAQLPAETARFSRRSGGNRRMRRSSLRA